MIDFDHRIAARRISSFTSKSEEEAFRLFFDSGLTGSFEEGRLSPVEFFRGVREALGADVDYTAFKDIWNGIFFVSDKNRAVIELCRRLRASLRLGLVTNINSLHFEQVKTMLPPLEEVFHAVVTSFECGVRKPHPSIYQQALKRLRLSADRVFYTDDRPELVAGARELGIRGTVFTGRSALEEELRAAGVSIPAQA